MVPIVFVTGYELIVPNYRDYEAFKCAHLLALSSYRVTRHLPADERFGLSAQIRRAAVSVPANIVEGAGRGSDRDFARFLRIAIGSANEVEYLLDLAADLGLLQADAAREASALASRTRQMLERFHQSLTRSGG